MIGPKGPWSLYTCVGVHRNGRGDAEHRVSWPARVAAGPDHFRAGKVIDLLILLAFVTYSIGNGFRNRARASESLEEYFLAGRTVRGWRAGRPTITSSKCSLLILRRISSRETKYLRDLMSIIPQRK